MTTTINADNGVSSGSAGLKSSADSSGVLALQTNGTTALSISTGQVVSLTNALTASGVVSYSSGDNSYSGAIQDITGASITITTQARRVLVGFTADVIGSTGQAYFNITVDGTNLFGSNGIYFSSNTFGGNDNGITLTTLTSVLSAGSHTFKARIATTGGSTWTVRGGGAGNPYQFWVQELA
jgi:hypothetical protein